MANTLDTRDRMRPEMPSAGDLDSQAGLGADISLTERAAERIRDYAERSNSEQCMRIGVRPSGCSGLAYTLDLASGAEDDDRSFESHGVQIVIDRKSVTFLAGTELDYVREGLSEGFRFNNPNVKESCGCGESFTV